MWMPVAVATVAGALVASVTLADGVRPSNKWRIEINEGANNDGVLRFRVTPEGGTPVEVAVDVKEGRSENGVAADVQAALRAALPAENFHIETDDGEDVLVKKKAGPDFALELVEDTVKGTNVDVDRE
jgi:hypothetical protein